MEQQSFSFAGSQDNAVIVPAHSSLIDVSCELVLEQYAQQLPDLSDITILLSDSNAVNQSKIILLQKAADRGYPALLGPQITSLHAWLNDQVDIDPGIVNNHSRELFLVDALQKHEHIYGHGSPWVLAESLMELFDELTQWHVELPVSVDDFISKLSDAYGSTDEISKALGREALLVHTLWYALHQQLSALNLIDQQGAHLLKLGQSIKTLPEHQQLIYCGVNPVTPAEAQWAQQLAQRNQLKIITHDWSVRHSEKGTTDYIQCLNLIFDYQRSHLKHRARECRKQFPLSPVASVIQVYAASDAEDEALAVDVQVRRWLLQGKSQIGIVTENRKLARRIRALLERANVIVEDNAGWPLSTTSAATVLERWLEAIEDDFHYLPLLDCLKSPFFMEHNEDYLKQVYSLEQHIIVDENVASGITRYLTHIDYRKHKLQNSIDTSIYDQLKTLLQDIAHAAEPLLPLLDGRHYDAPQFLDALLESLSRLHIAQAYSNDAAGQQLLNEIEQLKVAARLAPTQLTWATFRNWLGLTLERFNFKPPNQHSPVQLLTLSSTEYYSFDAIIIAGAELGFLPHGARQSPFFNDAVRSALGTPTQEDKQRLNFFLFRRLLTSIPPEQSDQAILITRRARENDEEIIASPWLAELQSFHQLAWGTDLSTTDLSSMINDDAVRIKRDSAALPLPANIMPSVTTAQALLPRTISASAYQQLVDCPYRFYAAYCLRLAPPDTVKEALEKSDYGQRIHKCLEAFHGNVSGLPGPFKEKITPQNRQQAIALLERITETVFSQDIEDNFMHRGWLKRWLPLIPKYIDWQMEQEKIAAPAATEVTIQSASLDQHVNIRGIIDRVDESQDELRIIDYKTGQIPSTDDVLSGEAVQLPFYLMLLLQQPKHQLADRISHATVAFTAQYVDLGNGSKVATKLVLDHDDLRPLAQQHHQRLIETMQQIRQGDALPAWGDDQSCKYCPMDGLCRKQCWETSQ